jgi:uncharacterized protein (DUF983 family)
MPRSKPSSLNPEDLIMLAMAIIGLIIVIHAILVMNATPPSHPTTMVVIIPRQVALIAP